MASIPSSAHLLAFEAVARRRSFVLAAAELHLTASAVSHQVAKLEAQLGVRLFERSAHGVRLSRGGQAYLDRVGGALAAIVSATEDLRHSVGNSLYVHCAPSIASLWLMPRLRDFASACPDIALNLSAAHSHSDFALGQADIDIRYGIPQWPELEVEPLFEERVLPLASPAFVAEHGLARVQQLLHVPLIQSNISIVQWSDWFQAFTQLRAPERFGVRFDRAQMSLDAGGHIADGRLVAPFGMEQAVRVKAHFAVYPPRNAHRPAVAAFLAWLHGEAARTEQQPCRQRAD
jgi:DNA-binding transcriptional LysR family regulator